MVNNKLLNFVYALFSTLSQARRVQQKAVLLLDKFFWIILRSQTFENVLRVTKMSDEKMVILWCLSILYTSVSIFSPKNYKREHIRVDSAVSVHFRNPNGGR